MKLRWRHMLWASLSLLFIATSLFFQNCAKKDLGDAAVISSGKKVSSGGISNDSSSSASSGASTSSYSSTQSTTSNSQVQNVTNTTNTNSSAKIGEVIGNVEGVYGIVKKNAQGVDQVFYTIKGWACAQNSSASIDIHFYLNAGYGGAGSAFVAAYKANLPSEAAVASKCGVSSGSFRFEIPLDYAFVDAHQGQPILIYGISPVGKSNNEIPTPIEGGIRMIRVPKYPVVTSANPLAMTTAFSLPLISSVTFKNQLINSDASHTLCSATQINCFSKVRIDLYTDDTRTFLRSFVPTDSIWIYGADSAGFSLALTSAEGELLKQGKKIQAFVVQFYEGPYGNWNIWSKDPLIIQNAQ